MSTKIKVARISRDEVKKAQAHKTVLELIRDHFPEFDETKGDVVTLLEDVLVTEEAVINLREKNEIALVWRCHR